ncbi:MAG: hypothetical protein IT370_12195 [Deltaproteobacteria bacterium]|nr:hypothetical protein [Deltaproteobacteria bacterium]
MRARRARRASVVVGIALALASCSKVNKDGGPKPSQSPAPMRALPVEVTLISAVLADDCQKASAAPPKSASAGDMVKVRDAKTARRDTSADDAKRAPRDSDSNDSMAERPARSCRQSTVQLHLVAAAGDAPARVELAKVELLDAKGDKHIQELGARNPQVWSASDGRYRPWDGVVSPTQDLEVSFDLGAPDWAKIGGGDPFATEGMGFKLIVVVRVDGRDHSVDVVVHSPYVAREPEVDT